MLLPQLPSKKTSCRYLYFFLNPKLTSMKTIFLQDTEEDILYILGFALRQEGNIVHVTSGLDEHILELIAEAKPHVVII